MHSLAAPPGVRTSTLPLDALMQEFASDEQSGAVELANRAAHLIMRFCDDWHGDGRQFKQLLIDLCRQLIAAQPGMTSVLNLCNEVLQATERDRIIVINGRPQPATEPQAASNAALRFTAFLAHHARRIANEALPYIHSGSLLLTHSYSATVLAALLRAKHAGKRFGVVCGESLPQFEGVRMARALAGHGIAVEVIVDAAAAVFIHGFYTLPIGADAISAQGVVNKVGTLGLALAARAQGIPVYCLAGSEKFLTSGAPFALVERAGDELLPPAPNLRGFNLGFDQTPLELITRYFTEDGVLAASELRDRLHQSTLHAAFQFSVTKIT